MLRRASNERAAVSGTDTFPAPSDGWVQSGNVVTASRRQAELLDNFFPTAQGARLRGGSTLHADLGAAVKRLFAYSSGGAVDMFGSTATKVFDVDRIVGGGSNAFGDAEGLASGDWATTQISTSGGQFMVMVNGVDYMMYWDGTDLNPISDVAVNDLAFDAETSPFTVGQTVTGSVGGASAPIVAIIKTSATAGILRLGAITAGPFRDDETLTDGATGSATADGVDAAGSTVTITNVATNTLSQAWLFKERLFFVEKDTSSIWYLPVKSIGGAAVEIDLGSVFGGGGSVLFGATWSLDSGSGMDDVCVIVSTEGEIAVYQGTDPASASTWALVGVYKIGKPLDKHAHFSAGGDLAILTEDGIVPVSEALKKDRAALQVGALTYPIEDAWKAAVSEISSNAPITAALWQSRTLLVVGTTVQSGNLDVAFVANARTGAWGRCLGWDVQCQVVAADQLYFGTAGGKVIKADDGGDDEGAAYTGYYVPKFADADVMRSGNLASLTYKCTDDLGSDVHLHMHADYRIRDMTPPPPMTITGSDVWGTAVWGSANWGSDGELNSYTTKQAAYADGYSMAPGLAITSNQTQKPSFEIQVMRSRYETGYGL